MIGLLDSGEVLIDDISVIENPDTTRRQMLRNGSFETGTADWRLLGNHRHAGVIPDPLDPGNNVLRLTATGPTEHMHNHLETTLVDTIRNGRTYEISFRAKWISGSNQFHSRLYFNRLPMTTLIERPLLSGTPGATNSTAETNIGPIYDGFIHSPAVPQPQQPVVVTVRAEDPDDVVSMRLWYSVNGGGWTSVGMSHLGDGLYSGSIPGRTASTVVQFYVEGQDRLGASSTFPAAGRDSRAMVKVDDGLASSTGVHNMRLIVTPADRTFLHTDINWMSNDRIGTTLIYDEQEIFYDVGMRLKGSERGRVTSSRLGFNVKFNPDQLFRGVLGSLSLDRSQGVGFGQREILNDIMATQSGSIPGEYNDLAFIMTPLSTHTSMAVVQMARFTDVFLDEQFESGSEGNVYEYELIYYPTTTNGSGFKRPQPDRVVGTNIRSLGDDPESYRWNFLKKNNRDEDDFSQLIAFAKVMQLSGSAFNDRIGDVIDVDQFLRAHAIATLTGMGDNYTQGAQHNAQFYVRPSDGRVLYFPHDLDAFPNANYSIAGQADLNKLIAVPSRARIYYGHLHDIISTTWNRTDMQRWTDHFAQLLPGQTGWGSYLSFIDSRSRTILSQVNSRAPDVTFAITTGGGNDFEVDTPSVLLEGDGWINVREIRLAGSDRPLLVEWTDRDSWRVDVPLRLGENPLTFEAYDFQGELIASDSITVESTAHDTRVADALRITELMFNPAQLPGGAAFNNDDFEFIELKNISSEAISLEGVRFDNGVDFDFAGNLGPGEFTVVVQNRDAFLSRYVGFDQDLIAGEYTPDNLRNSGERIELLDQFGQAIHNFRYGNDWYDGIEGDGFSLTVRDATADVSLWDVSQGWRPSSLIGGSP
ncbi:MAG: CotH kinase family protein, partial [Planctomycetes bacterium]|nr:CotH kinase family protein [Planctomycetota bacterium]